MPNASLWMGAAMVLGLTQVAATAADERYQVVIDPSNSYGFVVLDGKQPVMRLGAVGWGPNWSWTSISSKQKAENGKLSFTSPVKLGKTDAESVQFGLEAQSTGADSVRFVYTLKAERQLPLTAIAATLGASSGGEITALLTNTDGETKTLKAPAPIGGHGTIQTITINSPTLGGPITLTLDPPTPVTSDGDLRIALASEKLPAGERKVALTMKFPQAVAFRAGAKDIEQLAPVVPGEDWFAYQGKWDTGESVIGMEDWLEKPAGKRGGVRMVGDQFQLEDGTPIQFWGTNLSYGLSAPAKKDAEFTAARFAKYGVNAVRMHKFSNPGWEGIGDEQDGTKMKPEGMDRLDYFSDQLAKKGIYFGWSHSFGFKLRPGDRDRIAGFDEIMAKGGSTYGVINFAEDVQDLMIEMVVNLLKHENPYSGKAYAQDPALCFIELQNEDDIFFYTTETAYRDYPTYRAQLQQRFAQWLTTKYQTQEKLAEAWGDALAGDESLAQSNINVQPNPWHMSDSHLPSQRDGARQRLLDNAAFLHEMQNRFYSKFVKAIRETGYQGPICGSPWQAPAMLPHYYNLRSDYLVGYIDRHDYFGGSLSDTLLKTPGGGYLSAGLQQVVDRPFGLSEWIHVYPSLYSAEGPLLVAAYGMGLQGWDCSYQFQSTSARPSEIVGNQPWGVWNGDAPTQMGQFPLISRMVLRGDVKQSEPISVRRVSLADLQSGQFRFADKIEQQGDVKVFGGAAPAQTLAAGRAVVEFTDAPADSLLPQLEMFRSGNVIKSATGQLTWDAGRGVAIVNTPGTQGYVGFASGERLQTADMVIAPETDYAMIVATAIDRQATLKSADRVLLGVVARNANTGMRVLTVDDKTIVDNGRAPMLLEPVKATIEFPGRSISEVIVLDHDGKRTSVKRAPVGQGFTIDGAADKALYYEVVFR